MKKQKLEPYLPDTDYPCIYKPTNDDWYGNFEKNRVALMYIGELRGGGFRVLVTGNDDTGYEKDYDTEHEAKTIFERLSNYPMINYSDVKQLGFVHK